MIPRDTTRKIQGKLRKTKGKLKETNRKIRTPRKSKENERNTKGKQTKTNGNICSLAVTYGVNGTCRHRALSHYKGILFCTGSLRKMLIPRDATRKIQGKLKKTKGKLKGTDRTLEHHRKSEENQRNTKGNKRKTQEHQRNIWSLPVTLELMELVGVEPRPPIQGNSLLH